jgi:hypothetical protein
MTGEREVRSPVKHVRGKTADCQFHQHEWTIPHVSSWFIRPLPSVAMFE